jgi:tetratricopeptide (TPR) repeat protein
MVQKNVVSYIPQRTRAGKFFQTSENRTSKTPTIHRQSLSRKNASRKRKKIKQKKSSQKSKQDDSLICPFYGVDDEQMTDDLSNFILEERENLDDSTIIWLRSPDDMDIESISRLRTIVNRVKTFRNMTTCLNYIYLLQEEKIFFIVTSTFILDVLLYIDEPPEIQFVYIVGSVDKTYEQELKNQHPKIRGTYREMENLAVDLANDVITNSKMVMHLSVFTTDKEENSVKDLQTENPSRMWLNLLIEILLRMPQTKNSRDEMIAECKLFYADNPIELKKIDDFQTNYAPTNAIKWYTYDCFLFRQFNKACRTKNIDALYNLRFFLIDLENQLQELFKSQFDHTSPIFTVYRGQLIAPNELQKLKDNVGGLVSMNTYLSTTKLCAVASDYAGNGSGHPFIESVVFEIEMDVKKVIKPFADIQQVSIMKDEGEILFSIGTVFKIESVDEVLENVWFVKLTLSKVKDEELKRLEDYFINQIGETSDLEILYNYFYMSGDHDHAIKYSKTMIKSEINDLTEMFGPSEKYFNPLGPKPSEKDYNSAKMQRQKELAENIKSLPADDPILTVLYNNAGISSTAIGDYSEALVYFEKALDNLKQCLPNDLAFIATIYKNIAIVYESQGDYRTALKKLEIALQMQRHSKPLDYCRLAATYRYMGECYAIQNKFALALRFFQKSIQVSAKYLPLNHPKFAELHSALADVYNDDGRHEDALKHYQKALSIAKNALPPDNLELLCYQEKIDDLKTGSARIPLCIHMHWMGEYLRC